MAKEQSEEDIRAEDRASQSADLGADEIESRAKPEQSQGDSGGDKPQEKPAPQVINKFADKRKMIADKAKEMRHGGAKDPDLESEVAKARRRTVGSNVASPAVIEDDPVDDPVVVDAQDDKPADKPASKHKLKVHGREVELDDAQLLAAAQKAMASDDILAEAKAARSEARELLETVRAARADQPAAAAQPQKSAKPATPAADDVDMDEVIERIQVGTPEAGIAALEKFGDRIERRLLAKIGNLDEVIANQVDQVTEARIRDKETRDVIATFGADNPEFAASKALQGALALETADTMRNNMREIGVEEGVLAGFIERTMAQHPGMPEAQAVGAAYRFLQSKGHELPDHGQVLSTAAASIRKQMGMPERRPAATPPAPRPTQTSTSQHVAQRTERKQVMQTQPRRASTPPSMEAQEQSRDDARRKAVMEMRASRGRR